MVRVAAVATIAVVVLLSCSSATTDASETTTTGPQSVSTVTTQPPTRSIATTTTAHTTTSTLPVSAIVLHGDGLGVVSFGDRVDDVLAILTDLLGTPTFDEVHTDVMTRFDVSGEAIPFGYYRRVGWSPPGLSLESVDWDLSWAPLDRPVFTYWTAGGPLRTAEGVGPGSLWVDMAAIYGDDASAWSEDCSEYSGTMYFFPGEGENELRYFGWLADDPTDPTTFVKKMEAGTEAFSQGC